MIRRYEILTGGILDLDGLDAAQRRAAEEFLRLWNQQPDWREFCNRSQESLKKALAGVPRRECVRHPLYRMAHDLEMRLGIAQGKVAPLDYRDYVFDKIKERFGTRYKFCKATGISEAFLSQVISGEKDFSLGKLKQVAEVLGLGLALLPMKELKKAPWTEAAALREVDSVVTGELAALDKLAKRLRRLRGNKKWRSAIEESRKTFLSANLEQVLERLSTLPDKSSPAKSRRMIDEEIDRLRELQASMRKRLASLADPGSIDASIVRQKVKRA